MSVGFGWPEFAILLIKAEMETSSEPEGTAPTEGE